MAADFISGDDPSQLPGQQVNPPAAVGGDMTKVVYDSNNDGKVNSADSADNAGHATTADSATDITGAASAGADHYYGTDSTGTPGMWPLPLIGGGGGGGDGEANTTSNVGTGVGLAKAKVGVNLPFKTLKAGTNITLNESADEVEIVAAGGGGGSALTLEGDDSAHDPFLDEAVTYIFFDTTQFALTPGGAAGEVEVSLQPDFVAGLGGGGAPSLYPVWRSQAGYQIFAGANGKTNDTASAISPGFTANRTWVIPFLNTQNARLNSVGMSLAGTIPAGNMEFAIQPFPSNPDTPDVPVQYNEAIAYSSLINDSQNNLTTPVIMEPGLYLLYVRCQAAAASMTTKKIVALDSVGTPLFGDPLSAMFWYQGHVGGVALQRNYSTFTLNVGQFPHPLDDGTAVATFEAPRVKLFLSHLLP